MAVVVARTGHVRCAVCRGKGGEGRARRKDAALFAFLSPALARLFLSLLLLYGADGLTLCCSVI